MHDAPASAICLHQLLEPARNSRYADDTFSPHLNKREPFTGNGRTHIKRFHRFYTAYKFRDVGKILAGDNVAGGGDLGGTRGIVPLKKLGGGNGNAFRVRVRVKQA